MNRATRRSLAFLSILALAAGLPAVAAEPSLVESFDRLDASVWRTYGRGRRRHRARRAANRRVLRRRWRRQLAKPRNPLPRPVSRGCPAGSNLGGLPRDGPGPPLRRGAARRQLRRSVSVPVRSRRQRPHPGAGAVGFPPRARRVVRPSPRRRRTRYRGLPGRGEDAADSRVGRLRACGGEGRPGRRLDRHRVRRSFGAASSRRRAASGRRRLSRRRAEVQFPAHARGTRPRLDSRRREPLRQDSRPRLDRGDPGGHAAARVDAVAAWTTRWRWSPTGRTRPHSAATCPTASTS